MRRGVETLVSYEYSHDATNNAEDVLHEHCIHETVYPMFASGRVLPRLFTEREP
jgi:hypothetical protein